MQNVTTESKTGLAQGSVVTACLRVGCRTDWVNESPYNDYIFACRCACEGVGGCGCVVRCIEHAPNSKPPTEHNLAKCIRA